MSGVGEKGKGRVVSAISLPRTALFVPVACSAVV